MDANLADPPPEAWIGFALFTISGAWTVIGNIVLVFALKRRGIEVPFLLKGSAAFFYPFYRPSENPRATDGLALSVAIAVVVLVGTVYFLGAYMWPEAFATS